MKKFKVLAALLLAAVMSLGTFGAVFAEDIAPLAVTGKDYIDTDGVSRGKYPVVTGYDDLNKKIANLISDEFQTCKGLISSSIGQDSFVVEYTVTDHKEYAYATVELKISGAVPYLGKTVTYYFDKEAKKQLDDKAAYDKAIEAAKTAAEEAAKAAEEAAKEDEDKDAEEADEEEGDGEVVMIRLSAILKDFGFDVVWNAEDRSIKMSFGDFTTSIKIGVNEYIVDGEIVELEAAPEIQNNYTYVPLSFFTKVLGFTYEIDENGDYVFTMMADGASHAEDK